MENIRRRFSALGVEIPEILVPKENISLESWAVIACDQFTQDHSYWKAVEAAAGQSPSALSLIFPEIYLEAPDRQERIELIHNSMCSYINEGIFAPGMAGFMYIERATPHNPRRGGLVLAIDLENYEWQAGKKAAIRATEGTIPSRLPPRMEIRRGAALESPHILLLVDDEKDALFSGLAERAKKNPPVYRSNLMLDSGSIQGWFLGPEDWEAVAAPLEELWRRSLNRYGFSDEAPFLFAVGDGNHSLATAKEIWEEFKKARLGDPSLMGNPARYALVELENLYDPGIVFEPIHRVVFGISEERLLKALSALPGFESRRTGSRDELLRLTGERDTNKTRYGLLTSENFTLVEASADGIATKPLEPILDRLILEEASSSIDYIHGEDECLRIINSGPGAAAIILPPIAKGDLFKTVARDGPLPRKSFSMGEAVEKRFYLECRRLL